MKKLAILIPLLLVAALTNNNAEAAVYVISSTATDTGDCLAPNSCATITFFDQNLVGGDTAYWIPAPTMYTSTGNPNAAPASLAWSVLPNHVSSYITLSGTGDPAYDGWGDIRFPTSCVIFNGYSNQFGVSKSSYIVITKFYGIDGNGAIPILDSHHIKVMKVGVKNPTPHASQYTAGVSLNSNADAFQPSSSDCLLEDVWVIGEARYSVIVGGTVGFADHNVLRRVVVRWDGNSGNQPTAPVSIYGATGGVDGARNTTLQNVIVIDNNSSSFKTGGENIYGMIYFPHSTPGTQVYDSIVFANAAGYGIIPGEDSASNNAIYNSLIFGQTGPGIFTNSQNLSSTTFRGNTIGYTTGNGFDKAHTSDSGSAYRFENNQYYRIGGTVEAVGAGVDNYNGYFPSTSNPTGSTNEVITDPSMVVGSSVNPTVAQYGGGLNGANVGCTILYQRGVSGSLWGQSGWNDLQTSTPLFPWYHEAQLKAFMAKADSGNALANNSSNVTTRGWAGTSVALADYTYNGVKLGFAAGAQQGGGDPPPDPGVQGEPIPRRLGIDGSVTLRGVNFQ